MPPRLRPLILITTLFLGCGFVLVSFSVFFMFTERISPLIGMMLLLLGTGLLGAAAVIADKIAGADERRSRI